MPRSSRHKSHKQSKHKEQSDSDDGVRMNYVNGKDEFSVAVSRDLGSSEKRKVSSSKDISGHGYVESMQEYIDLKRKREKIDSGAAMDRWNSGAVDIQDSITMEKEVKADISRGDADKNSRSKVSSDTRSKSTKKHETFNEKKEEIAVTMSEKEERRIGGKVDLKRKSDKDQGRKQSQQSKNVKESKDRDRGLERKVDSKRDFDVQVVVSDVTSKHMQTKRDSAIQDDFRNPELEKELEKRTRKRSDSYREKKEDNVRDSESRRVSSKSDHIKNGRHKDEKRKDGSFADKHSEDVERESRYKEDKYHEDHERNKRNKDGKHRDSKYREDFDRESRHKEDKYHDGGHRESRYEDSNHLRGDSGKSRKKREDKYLEDDNADNRYKDGKQHENSNGESKAKDDKYHDDRHRDDKYREKHNENIDKDTKRRDGKQRDEYDRVKRHRDNKYRDENLREGSHDKSDVKRVRTDSNASECHKKSTNQDVYDHSTWDKDDKERRRGTDKDHSESKSCNTKDHTSEADRKHVGGARIEALSDQGKSSSRNADLEGSPSRIRRRFPNDSSAAAKIQSRTSIQEDVYEERSWNRLSSKNEFGGAVESASISRSNDRSINKDDLKCQEISVERRQKLDSHTSPLLADKSPSSASTEHRHFNRSDARRSLDIDDSKDYPSKEGRGSRDLTTETFHGNDDTMSVSSSFTRSNNHTYLPPPSLFKKGSDNHAGIGSMEEDTRGKYYNRHRRAVGDSSIARIPQGNNNAWKGIQTWPSPVANGFMTFQHGPPAPVGFHPMMQQFPGPPMFGIRPPMDLNHSGYGRPLGWHDPMVELNNSVFRDESHMYGMPGWDQNRAIAGVGVQPWDTHHDSWKATVEINNMHGSSEEVSAVQTENDQNLQNAKTANIDVTQPVAVENEEEDTLTTKISSEEMQKPTEISKKDDVYLSKLDVSLDLAVPDLYNSCMKCTWEDADEKTNSDKDVSVILLLEGYKRNRSKNYEPTSKSLAIPATDEAIFQNAMSVYVNHSEGWVTLADKVLQPDNNTNDVDDGIASEDDKPVEAEEEDPIEFPENKGKVNEIIASEEEQAEEDPIEFPENKGKDDEVKEDPIHSPLSSSTPTHQHNDMNAGEAEEANTDDDDDEDEDDDTKNKETSMDDEYVDGSEAVNVSTLLPMHESSESTH